LRGDRDGFATEVLRQAGALDAWRESHDHHLHPAGAMEACLRQHFSVVQTAAAPYLYRYVCAVLADDEPGYKIAVHVLELEQRFADLGHGPLIGRRFVCPGDAA
jgi:hypothetical protein